jgi:hypothetical protein
MSEPVADTTPTTPPVADATPAAAAPAAAPAAAAAEPAEEPPKKTLTSVKSLGISHDRNARFRRTMEVCR